MLMYVKCKGMYRVSVKNIKENVFEFYRSTITHLSMIRGNQPLCMHVSIY